MNVTSSKQFDLNWKRFKGVISFLYTDFSISGKIKIFQVGNK